ncbi:MAG: RNase adapter RapZ [Clostridia bacterium]|nr:RNase adapter RapZ [Clostridia bacterium]
MDIIFLTGMSGAGKSQAVHILEDQGYFCIDNLPPVALPGIVATFTNGQGGEGYGIEQLAFVVDIRSKELLKGFGEALKKIDKETPCPYKVIFLEANDDVLISRYRQTRRKHPLSKDISLMEAINTERKMLQGIRGRADYVVDTSMMVIPALKEEILNIIGDDITSGMSIYVESFGFKYGLPKDCDNVFDVRFLPNPFYIQELKLCSGLDKEIGDYLEKFDETVEYKQKIKDLLLFSAPLYVKEGKGRLHIGIGCTGGRHRSVYIAEYINGLLLEAGYKSTVHHRDIDKDPRYGKSSV